MRPNAGDWVSQAACAGLDTELFFAVGDGALARAKAICASCPVRQQCLRYAMRLEAEQGNGFRSGVFGGTSARERGRLRKVA